jgi:predicted secreted hydrolase
MFYRLRRPDGRPSPFSSGALVLADGKKIALSRGEVRLTERRRWRSPRRGRSYPVVWRLEVPARGLSLEIEPRLDDQEVRSLTNARTT